MSYEIYRLLHFTGIFMIFLSLGGVTLYVANGGSKNENCFRKLVGMSHGLGLLFALLGGFGMLVKLQIPWPWPGWIFGKLLIWLLLGGMSAFVYRKSLPSTVLWLIMIFLGFAAAALAGLKPF